jgi:hypothetical protein
MPYKSTKRKANQANNENKENESDKIKAEEKSEHKKDVLDTIDQNRAHNAGQTPSKRTKRVYSMSEQISLLKELLLNAKSPGSQSTGGLADELPTAAGIYVKDFGLVSLPLNSPQAEELIKKCSVAPYGEFIST